METQVILVGGDGNRSVGKERQAASVMLSDCITGFVRKRVGVERLVGVGKVDMDVKIVCLCYERRWCNRRCSNIVGCCGIEGEDEENITDEEEDGDVKLDEAIAVASEDRMMLGFDKFSVAVSFVMFDDLVLIGRIREEEEIRDGKITLIFSSGHGLQSVKKSGGVSPSNDAVQKGMEQAQKRVTEMLQEITYD